MVEELLERFGLAGFADGSPPEPASVVVDATALDTSHRGRGIGRYVSGLLSGMAEILEDRPGRWVEVFREELEAERPVATLRLGGRLHELLGPGGDDEVAGGAVESEQLGDWQIRRPPVRHFYRWVINELVLERELSVGGARLYHGTEPWSLPVSPSFRTVLTCHDVIPLMFPEEYLNLDHWDWRLYFRRLRREGRWAQCDRIIAISEATKRNVVDYLDVDPGRISVVPNGIDHDDFAPVDDEHRLRRFCRKYDIDRPYALYLGGYDYRKNISTLVRAAAFLPDDASLVLAGGMGAGRKWRLEALARDIGVDDRISLLGYVDDSDLRALYSAADVFAYPSLAEGFGLQVLEAMTAGCPVVASDATSLPEVVGDAGLLVDPEDPYTFGQALRRVLTDDELQRELTDAGFERAREFSWRRCAEETLEVYERTLREAPVDRQD